MTKNDRNSAKAINTWLGGICCVARDVRTNESTMTIRVKEVIRIKIPGASEKTVSNKIKRTEVDIFVGSELENISINSFISIFLISFDNRFSRFLQTIQFLIEQAVKLILFHLFFLILFQN